MREIRVYNEEPFIIRSSSSFLKKVGEGQKFGPNLAK
jgi:hypothetical protein